MDGKTIRNKLVGSDDERAVSPVIGVILMVAITVILAAVIATLVMDFGDSTDTPINAQVDSDVNGNDTVALSVTENGDAQEFVLRGDTSNLSDTGPFLGAGTGDTMTVDITASTPDPDWEGTVNIIALDGDREDNAGSFEYSTAD